MPRKRPITTHGYERWEVDFGEDHTGKKQRSTFRTEGEADRAIEEYEGELKKCGEYWARMKPLDRELVVATLKDIVAQGQTLPSVWADWQRWRKEHANSVTEVKAYEDVIKEWRKRKLDAGKSLEYVDESDRYVLRKFGDGRMRQPIHEIAVKDLQDWINSQGWSLRSKRTNTGVFSSLWQTAVDLGYTTLNICDRLEAIGEIAPDVRIYPNETVINLLAACISSEITRPVLLPLVLGLFGCMRPEEVSVPPEDTRLKAFGWPDINLKHKRINVRQEIAKTGDVRVIRLQPAAVEWIELCQEYECPLPPLNERKLVDLCCEMIGLDDWIYDGLRKCCCTHLRTIYRSDYEVVKDMGNSIRIMLKHYADLHTPEEVSKDYWKINPARVKAHLKTKAWLEVVQAAEKAREAKAAKARQEQMANGTAKPAN